MVEQLAEEELEVACDDEAVVEPAEQRALMEGRGVGDHVASPEAMTAVLGPRGVAAERDPAVHEMAVDVAEGDAVGALVGHEGLRHAGEDVGPVEPVVGAEEEDPVAGDVVEGVVPGVVDAPVALGPPVGDPLGVALHDRRRPVGRGAVHDHQLDVGIGLGGDAVEGLLDRGGAVPYCDYDRDPRSRRGRPGTHRPSSGRSGQWPRSIVRNDTLGACYPRAWCRPGRSPSWAPGMSASRPPSGSRPSDIGSSSSRTTTDGSRRCDEAASPSPSRASTMRSGRSSMPGDLVLLDGAAATTAGIVLVCVGTPIDDDGHADTRAVVDVLAELDRRRGPSDRRRSQHPPGRHVRGAPYGTAPSSTRPGSSSSPSSSARAPRSTTSGGRRGW